MLLANQHYHIISFDEPIDLLQLYQFDPSFYAALLESVSSKNSLAKAHDNSFDLLFFDPGKILFLDSQQQLYFNSEQKQSQNNDFLSSFNQQWEKEKHSIKSIVGSDYYPFSGGWFVFLSYELANQIETRLQLTHFDSQLPIAYACRYRNALMYDHQKKQLVLFCEERAQIQHYSKKIKSDLASITAPRQLISATQNTSICIDAEQYYLDSVNQIKRYIIEGDVFQVNLSMQWRAEFKAPHHQLACSLYQHLRKNNPAPFAAIANLAGKDCITQSIISSSPERLIRVKDKRIESRPIAGTRPRGKTAAEDQQLIKQLHETPKEQAEHVMLIDLIRNDLGRICTPGSIHVDEFMINETYQHVHHIVSNVVGNLAPKIQPGDIIRAVFPGGTITGCPKVRCMELIRDLEKSTRGVYTGSLGYINHNGSMDLNILIRTMLLDQDKNDSDKQFISLRAGAGIVAESIAEQELLESHAKAKGMLKTLYS